MVPRTSGQVVVQTHSKKENKDVVTVDDEAEIDFGMVTVDVPSRHRLMSNDGACKLPAPFHSATPTEDT